MEEKNKSNKKMLQTNGDFFDIRIFHRASKGKIDPRYLLKCGCCDESVEIYYSEDSLEINGVHGSIDNWRKILLPLLKKNK